MNRKVQLILFLSLLLIFSSELAKRLMLDKKQKYDLDFCAIVNASDIRFDPVSKALIYNGFSFSDKQYRVYNNTISKTVVIQFINQDLNDADYIIPVPNKKFRIVNEQLEYDGRIYPRDTFRNLTKLSLDGTDYTLLQLQQPPPDPKFLTYPDFIQSFQIITIFLAICYYFFESAREKSIAQRSVYQQIELASIALFKFEIENVDLTYMLYDETVILDNISEKQKWALQEYTCQILNLFEMTIEFQEKGNLSTEVFLSWVRWFFDVGTAKHFASIWAGVDTNYTSKLRRAINLVFEDNDSTSDAGPDECYKAYLDRLCALIIPRGGYYLIVYSRLFAFLREAGGPDFRALSEHWLDVPRFHDYLLALPLGWVWRWVFFRSEFSVSRNTLNRFAVDGTTSYIFRHSGNAARPGAGARG